MTLRSAQLPQPTAAAVVVQALLAQVVSVDAEAANVQREQLPAYQAHMVVAMVAMAVLQPVSMLWVAVAAVAEDRRRALEEVLARTP